MRGNDGTSVQDCSMLIHWDNHLGERRWSYPGSAVARTGWEP